MIPLHAFASSFAWASVGSVWGIERATAFLRLRAEFQRTDVVRRDRMRFRIEHPAHPGAYATYGHDPHLGFFVEVVGKHGRQLDYDATYKDYCGLEGALAFLSKAGFFAIEDLHETLVRIEHEPEERLPAPLLRVCRLVWNFKDAADPEDP